MVSFADLPYGLQKRLVELAPANSLVDFEETGHLPLKLSRRLRKSAESVNILRTTDTELLKQNEVVRVCKTLDLRIYCPDEYQAMLALIRGSYSTLEIIGNYPWQLLIKLIRRTVSTVNTKPGMILPENEFDTFVNELYTIMTNQDLVVHVDGTCWVKLLPQLKSRARDFMHQRRRDGLNVSYIQVNLEQQIIMSQVIKC